MATKIIKKGIEFELSDVENAFFCRHRYLKKNGKTYIHFVSEYGKHTCDMLKYIPQCKDYLPYGELMTEIELLEVEHVSSL